MSMSVRSKTSASVDDYHELVNKIYTGENTVDSSIDKVPDVSVKVNMREGTIM